MNITACSSFGAAASSAETTENRDTVSITEALDAAAEISETAQEATLASLEEKAAPDPKVDIPLTGAPAISLSDSLSSSMNQFEVISGNYTWGYLDGKKTVELVACGTHPLDTDSEKVKKLHVPNYNRIEYASYTISCIVPPDKLTVREWDISQLGNAEAEANSTETYEYAVITQ